MCVSPFFAVPYLDDGEIKWNFHKDKNLFAVGVVDPLTGEFLEQVPISCGRCAECIQLHKSTWIHRLLDEASLYKENCFITLTYADAPADGVQKRDIQLFMKRLRKMFPDQRIRYFACGEYGSKGSRPHYHAILFNFDFKDKRFFTRDKKNISIYRSDSLEKLWPLGISSVAPCCDKTLEYVTKDMQKLLPKNGERNPPFTLMSSRPGIGFNAIKESSLESGKIYHNGRSIPLPRYYLSKMRGQFNTVPFETKRYYFLKAKAKINNSDKKMIFRLEKNQKFFDDLLTK